jgi:hypothetical protein
MNQLIKNKLRKFVFFSKIKIFTNIINQKPKLLNFKGFQMNSDGLVVLDNTQPTKPYQPNVHELEKCVVCSRHNCLNYTHIMDSHMRDLIKGIKPFIPAPKGKKRYLVTFTRDAKSKESKTQWYELLLAALQQTLHTFVSATIEHIEKNIHCHAILETKYNLSKDRYTKFSNKHRIDFKKIKWDNGTGAYMDKENHSHSNIKDFDEHFRPLIEILNKIN